MRLVRYSPVTLPRLTFGADLPGDRWLDEFFSASPTADWNPRADVIEKENWYEIAVELPGIEKENVKVAVENGLLTVSGESKSEHKDEGQGYYRLERRYGTFSRSFDLADGVDAEKIEASFKNGVLKLTVPKTVEVLPRKIEIKD